MVEVGACWSVLIFAKAEPGPKPLARVPQGNRTFVLLFCKSAVVTGISICFGTFGVLTGFSTSLMRALLPLKPWYFTGICSFFRNLSSSIAGLTLQTSYSDKALSIALDVVMAAIVCGLPSIDEDCVKSGNVKSLSSKSSQAIGKTGNLTLMNFSDHALSIKYGSKRKESFGKFFNAFPNNVSACIGNQGEQDNIHYIHQGANLIHSGLSLSGPARNHAYHLITCGVKIRHNLMQPDGVLDFCLAGIVGRCLSLEFVLERAERWEIVYFSLVLGVLEIMHFPRRVFCSSLRMDYYYCRILFPAHATVDASICLAESGLQLRRKSARCIDSQQSFPRPVMFVRSFPLLIIAYLSVWIGVLMVTHRYSRECCNSPICEHLTCTIFPL